MVGYLIQEVPSYSESPIPFPLCDFNTNHNSIAPSLDWITNLTLLAQRLLSATMVPALVILDALGYIASMIDILTTTCLTLLAQRLLSATMVPALVILEALGCIASMIEILPTILFHMRNIQLCLLHQWKGENDSSYI